jgi:hypothetical protein
MGADPDLEAALDTIEQLCLTVDALTMGIEELVNIYRPEESWEHLYLTALSVSNRSRQIVAEIKNESGF